MKLFTVNKEIIPVYEYSSCSWADFYYGDVHYIEGDSIYFIDGEKVSKDVFEDSFIDSAITELHSSKVGELERSPL